jgi:hypothetical protein
MEFDAYSGNPADAGSMIGHVRAHPKAWPRTDPILWKRTNNMGVPPALPGRQ